MKKICFLLFFLGSAVLFSQTNATSSISTNCTKEGRRVTLEWYKGIATEAAIRYKEVLEGQTTINRASGSETVDVIHESVFFLKIEKDPASQTISILKAY